MYFHFFVRKHEGEDSIGVVVSVNKGINSEKCLVTRARYLLCTELAGVLMGVCLASEDYRVYLDKSTWYSALPTNLG